MINNRTTSDNRSRKKGIRTAALAWVMLFALAAVLALPAAEREVQAADPAGETYTVSVAAGYLALRTATAYDSSNEIGELYTGDTVQVYQYTNDTYWYVYSAKYNKYGYVNKNYLIKTEHPAYPSGEVCSVKVDTGYLAIRTERVYDAANEIGKLYTGDTVVVTEVSDSTYWYIYSPGLDMFGFVNKDYLIKTGTAAYLPGKPFGVMVDKGYLALRTEKAYDSANEIGKLYTGNLVIVMDSGNDTYWYVYSPDLKTYGYVNKSYLVAAPVPAGTKYTVKVDKGYLALRNAQAYDESNEIGKLYTGDSVITTQTQGSTYWYVYAPGLNSYGYVNKNYLY